MGKTISVAKHLGRWIAEGLDHEPVKSLCIQARFCRGIAVGQNYVLLGFLSGGPRRRTPCFGDDVS